MSDELLTQMLNFSTETLQPADRVERLAAMMWKLDEVVLYLNLIVV
jgi:hypothetical protein